MYIYAEWRQKNRKEGGNVNKVGCDVASRHDYRKRNRISRLSHSAYFSMYAANKKAAENVGSFFVIIVLDFAVIVVAFVVAVVVF